MGSEYRNTGTGRDRSRAALARDLALDRVRRMRRWIIAGAAALTAGFVSAVAPGRTLAPKSVAGAETVSAAAATSASASSSGGSAIPRMPPPAKASDLGLQSPDQAPSASPSPSPSRSPGNSQSQSGPSQSQSAPSQSQSAPSQPDASQAAPAPTPAPAPAPAPPVVSGGS
jgi:hypothetical protein